MILGIGTDLTHIDRIEALLRRHGERFINRCFDALEITAAENSKKNLPSGYAKRWAAKEACAKALGLGITESIYLKDIIVTNDNHGKPGIILKNGAQKRLTTLTPQGYSSRIDLSLSDDYPMAIAFVIISAEAL